ncbi:hypothetical protein R5R35_004538 [Gryllus longicercus]|uniref:Accessory gland protein n=1 Tax=Gryllus longicercus TaxID=2509291 RepID=A0AAN9ZDB0_9ORTH
MRLILLVVLAAALAAPARAQLFPFSNLHSYFKSVSAGGPGADAGAEAEAEGDAEAAGTAPEAGEARAEPAAAAAEHVPSRELRPPANHRLHEADAQPAEAAPVVGLLRPASYPSQVLQPPPSRAPALDYAAQLAAAPSPSPAAEAVAFAPAFLPAPAPAPAASAAPAPAAFTAAQPSLVLLPPPSAAAAALPAPTAAPAAPPKPPPNHKPAAPAPYPKKYRPAQEKSALKAAVGPAPKKKHAPLKKASATALSKEQTQFKQQQRQSQHVAATVEAARLRPAPAEQVAAAHAAPTAVDAPPLTARASSTLRPPPHSPLFSFGSRGNFTC